MIFGRRAKRASLQMKSVHVVRCATAKWVGLRVDPSRGKICLVIPKRASEKKAWKFAHENREWIEAKLAKMEKPVPFIDGAIIPIFGKDRTLRIIRHDKRTTEIDLSEKTLMVRTSREDPTNNIKQFLTKMLYDIVWPMACRKAEQIDKKVVSVTMRNTRARWGSCATDGRMMFCWRLIFAPMVIIDYIVAHEVTHLKHMDHSGRFWAQCHELSEDMKHSVNWLDANGDRLLMYGLPS